MTSPFVLAIDARDWTLRLGTLGRRLSLGDVPAAELDRLRDLGLTHLWLLGVWPCGPRSRAQALGHAGLRAAYTQALPDWTEADVGGSPYAMASATVPAALGGDAGLARLRRALHDRGLRLILDFVPNHLGLDHPWAESHPARFVHASTPFAGSTPRGGLHLAHGRDPYFDPWTDTLQLDYRRAETRAAMIGLLQGMADRADGVRCDMAMLVLADVFARTWAKAPPPAGEATASDFWDEAIAAVRARHPGFLFMAEAYWGLEDRLLGLGFDFVYDKALLDHVVEGRHAEVGGHLRAHDPSRRVHFLENHDEPRIAPRLDAAAHRAAAFLTLSLPGLRFLHDGQAAGARHPTRIQLARRAAEPIDAGIAAIYASLLSAIGASAIGRGQGRVLATRRAWPDNESDRSLVVTLWPASANAFDLAVVNLAPHRAQGFAILEGVDPGSSSWLLEDRLGSERWTREGADLGTRGLYLDVAAHATQLFRVRRA